MSFAPSTTYFDVGDGTIRGSFVEKSVGNFFEFSLNTEENTFGEDYPHKVWVSSNPVNDSGWRYARVLKTVAYVVVDEDAEGNPVVEKWDIKEHNSYKELN
jgi:hypothetical protein